MRVSSTGQGEPPAHAASAGDVDQVAAEHAGEPPADREAEAGAQRAPWWSRTAGRDWSSPRRRAPGRRPGRRCTRMWSARPVAIVTVPPPGSASTAFLRRLSRICSTMAGSQVASTGRPPSWSSCVRTPRVAERRLEEPGHPERDGVEVLPPHSAAWARPRGRAPRGRCRRPGPPARAAAARAPCPSESCWASKSSRSSCRWPLTVLSGVPISCAKIAAVSCMSAEPVEPAGPLLEREQHRARGALPLARRQGLAHPVVPPRQLAELRRADLRARRARPWRRHGRRPWRCRARPAAARPSAPS